MNTMDHDYIEQFDIVDRYVMSRLVAEESEQFEEHLIDCQRCIDNMKAMRGLMQGFRLLTVQQAAPPQSDTAKRSEWFFSHWLSRKSWAAAACGLLLGILLISILAIIQILHLRQEAAQAESVTADLQRRHEDNQRSALALAQDRQQTEQNLKEHIQQLEADLQEAQKVRADAAGGPRGWRRPLINIPIVILNSVRGSEVTEINLSRTPMDFVISVPLEEKAKYRTYRVTVLKDQRSVWESNEVKPDSDNALIIGFNSSFFQQGKYVLQVKGGSLDSGSREVASYPFHVNKHP
jgi:hypothetical protein